MQPPGEQCGTEIQRTARSTRFAPLGTARFFSFSWLLFFFFNVTSLVSAILYVAVLDALMRTQKTSVTTWAHLITAVWPCDCFVLGAVETALVDLMKMSNKHVIKWDVSTGYPPKCEVWFFPLLTSPDFPAAPMLLFGWWRLLKLDGPLSCKWRLLVKEEYYCVTQLNYMSRSYTSSCPVVKGWGWGQVNY